MFCILPDVVVTIVELPAALDELKVATGCDDGDISLTFTTGQNEFCRFILAPFSTKDVRRVIFCDLAEPLPEKLVTTDGDSVLSMDFTLMADESSIAMPPPPPMTAVSPLLI
jgi:hypothetical protein